MRALGRRSLVAGGKLTGLAVVVGLRCGGPVAVMATAASFAARAPMHSRRASNLPGTDGCCRRMLPTRVRTRVRLSVESASHFSSASSDVLQQREESHPSPPLKIAVVGGGLAGLSTLYHLIDQSSSEVSATTGSLEIDVFDPCPVGTGGASSVAGGLLHPLSPRGKLVHWGLEGLEASDRLVREASDAVDGVVLRDEILRVAMSASQARALQDVARQHPHWAEWVTGEGYHSAGPHGAVRLSGGCRVIHVPTYLQGLWTACQLKIGAKTRWIQTAIDSSSASSMAALQEYDAVVLAAGDGLFHHGLVCLPMTQLVRGQSVEMRLDPSLMPLKDAILCGKYVSPMPQADQVLIGATHEYSVEPWSHERVIHDLRQRTTEGTAANGVVSRIWETGGVQRVTHGVRVQSARGAHGRLPIVGRWHPLVCRDASSSDAESSSPCHPNLWIFTGLSSRGLLYHSIYGQLLASAVLRDSQSELRALSPSGLWWHDFVAQSAPTTK